MRKIISLVLFVLLLGGLVCHFMLAQANPLAANLISLAALKGMQQEPNLLANLKPGLTDLARQDCRANWMLGVVLKRAGDRAGKIAAWQQLLACPGADLDFMIDAGRQDEDLARQIVSRYPENPAGLFSLAYLSYQQNSPDTASIFERGLSYDPANGAAWCYLGALYSSAKQKEQAVNAYLNCCRNGDPYGGCFRAGQLTEKMGDLRKAIEYYRLSTQENALNRARELEKQILP